MAKKVLVVDDEKLIVKGIRFSLEQDGMEVDCAYDGEEALSMAKEKEYDMILLDLMLPKLDGLSVCQQIREFSNVPIVMLTAKGEDMDKILGLEYGADDYITKPFDNQELLVRIEAVLRRFQKSTTPNNSKILRFKDLSLDTEAMEAKIRNTPITLTRYEYLILQLLMSSPSKVFTKNNIFESVWNENFIGDDNAINVHIGNLRKKFAKVNPEEKYIQTVWGLGFKMQG